jgi:hypothetical protein
MIIHYSVAQHTLPNSLTLRVPDGISPYWSKYLLRAALAQRKINSVYGTWVQF